MQNDLFSLSGPTFPPHLDPAKAGEVIWEQAQDRDHVGGADVGKVGNNREVYVVTVESQDGEEILYHQTFTRAGDAAAHARAIRSQIEFNRQQFLF